MGKCVPRRIGNEKIYLCENIIKTVGKPIIVTSAYKNSDKSGFIVESGANLPKAKREKQVMDYLNKQYKKKGYI